MKFFFPITFLLIAHSTYAQKRSPLFDISVNHFHNLTRDDFVKNNFSKIFAYAYIANQKGKIKKDSFLLYRREFDKINNRIFGIDYSVLIQSHGSASLMWNTFEQFYNQNGQIIKENTQPMEIECTKKYGVIECNTYINETEYEYDRFQKRIKEINKQITHDYSIFEGRKDTFHFHAIENPKISEYFYNTHNQKTLQYATNDSTKYLKTGKYDKDTTLCSYCHARYLQQEWKYNIQKQLYEWVSYTSENKLHSKSNYFYDVQGRFIKQIDSTGWYYEKPQQESMMTLQYTDTCKMITKSKSHFEEKTIYDKNDKILKQCHHYHGKYDCVEYLYIYKNVQLTHLKKIQNGVLNAEIQYFYNDKGVLQTEKRIQKGILANIVRYYYE